MQIDIKLPCCQADLAFYIHNYLSVSSHLLIIVLMGCSGVFLTVDL